MTRVLVVEDEQSLLRALSMNLTARGYDVVASDTGTRALAAAASQDLDVIVLDLGLPDLAGFDVIRGVRSYDLTPIVVLSARTDSRDKVTALDLGADDYITKPFNIDELLARLRAVTRRITPEESARTATIGETTVDFGAMTATDASGEVVHLTPTEWHLLRVLVDRPGRLVSREELLTHLRGNPGHTDPSYLRIYISQLRRKLEVEPSRPRHLLTEPGLGFRYQP